MPKVTTPPKVQLTIRIDKDVLDRLVAYSRQIRTPKSLLMQTALLRLMDAQNVPWPKEDNGPD